MKKLLVAACISLFAVGAWAVEVDFSGEHEVTGYLIQNINASDDGGDGPDQKNWSGIYHYAVLNGKLQVDPRAAFFFRAKMRDNYYGSGDDSPIDNLSTLIDKPFDRAWVEVKPIDELRIKAGRAVGKNYYRTFGAGFWGQVGEDSGSSDLIRLDFYLNDDITVYGAYEKGYDSFDNNGRDIDLWALGAEMMLTDDFGLYPAVTFFNNNLKDAGDDHSKIIAGYVAGEFLPATGLNVEAAFAISKDVGDYDNSDEKALLFGAFADIAYVMDDTMKVGVNVAYGSEDKDAARIFNYGADYGKLMIMNDGIRDGDSGMHEDFSTSLGGGIQAALYAEFMPMRDLTLFATAGIFKALLDGDYAYGLPLNYWGQNVSFTEDTFAWEVDLAASYQLTESTAFKVGAAIAAISDVVSPDPQTGAWSSDDTYDTDPIYMFFWSLHTVF